MFVHAFISPHSSFSIHHSASVLVIHHSAFMYVCMHAKKHTGLFVLYFYDKLIKYGIQSSPWYTKNQKLTVQRKRQLTESFLFSVFVCVCVGVFVFVFVCVSVFVFVSVYVFVSV